MPSSREILLVAGGVGLAPLVLLVEEAVRKRARQSGLRTATDQRYSKELLPKGIRLDEFTDDGSCGRRGLVTECVPDFWILWTRYSPAGRSPCIRALAKQQNLKGPSMCRCRWRRAWPAVWACAMAATTDKFRSQAGLPRRPVFNLDEVSGKRWWGLTIMKGRMAIRPFGYEYDNHRNA